MRVDILFGILLTLLNKKTVTAKYLAQKFEVSTRTIYRYLTVLDTNNIPLFTKSGRGGGIFLINTINLNTLFFTDEEKYALLELSQNITNQKLKIGIQTKLISLR